MDTERDLPEEGTAEGLPAEKSYDEQVGELSELLDDPAADLEDEDQDQDEADDTDPEDGEDADDEETEESEDVEDEDSEEDEDGPGEDYSGGRFAADNAKVKLEDGTVISVAELKRNNLFQRDYTKKTTELATEREEVTKIRSEVDQYAQQLNQSREYLAWFAENHMPKRPEQAPDPNADPLGYMQYLQETERFNRMQEAFQTFRQQAEDEQKRQSEAQRAETEKRLRAEAEKLKEIYPVLANPEKGRAFWEETARGANKHFGFTSEELASISDHRMVRVLRDAIAYRRLQSKAPQVKDEVARKPAIKTKAARRTDPKAKVGKERLARTERLRKTGDFDAGVEALMDFDL